MGSPPECDWGSTAGRDGTIMIIAKRLGLDNHTYGKMIRRTLELIQAGGDVRARGCANDAPRDRERVPLHSGAVTGRGVATSI